MVCLIRGQGPNVKMGVLGREPLGLETATKLYRINLKSFLKSQSYYFN